MSDPKTCQEELAEIRTELEKTKEALMKSQRQVESLRQILIKTSQELHVIHGTLTRWGFIGKGSHCSQPVEFGERCPRCGV